jgi:hypothetical protein
MKFLKLVLFSFFAISSLHSQNVNVSVNTTLSTWGGKVANMTYFYDVSNFPFVKEVARTGLHPVPVSLPKGKYIIKSDYCSFCYKTITDDNVYPRHFLNNRKSFWDADFIEIESDTTLNEDLAPGSLYYTASEDRYNIRNENQEGIKSIIITIYHENSKAPNKVYEYSSSATVDDQFSNYFIFAAKKNEKYYAFLFDPNAEYLPGYLTKNGSIVQNLSQTEPMIGSIYSTKNRDITMKKVVPPNGEFQIRGILDAALLKVFKKDEDEIQASTPIKFGIVVAYDKDNVP